jgi:iron complex outermembrane recepter protein
VAPEKSRSWEVGLKSQLWDRRITINIDAYNTRFTGYQTTSSGTDGSGAPVLRSAGSLLTKGVEGDISFRPIPGLSVGGNFLFADNKFGDLFINATTNLRGGDPLNAPETRYGFNGVYSFPVADFGVTVGGNYNWTSRTLFTNLADANNPNSIWIRPAFGVANATLAITTPDERLKLSIYVKNLFDKHYVDGLRRISGSVGGAGAVAQSLPRDFDRFIGGTLAMKF